MVDLGGADLAHLAFEACGLVALECPGGTAPFGGPPRRLDVALG